MTRVVAQGTFDILHPGHLHYLEEAAALGDVLHVIVARRSNVTHKDPPILSDRQRRDMVAAIETVDHARIGHAEDIFVPVEEIEPDIVVLGYDQHHEEDAIRDALASRGLECDVVRVSHRERRHEGELLSTGTVIERICQERC